jgi:hypothetical protein
VASDSAYHGYGNIVTTGTWSTSGTTLTITGNYNGIQNGQYVVGTGIPAGTTIVSGAGTASIILSATPTSNTTGTTTTVTFQGGTYTIAPCARVLYESGSTVVLESNSFSWTAADSVEEAIVSYPDVTGFEYDLANWTAGAGNLRAFMNVNNIGARLYKCGFCLTSNMPSGSNVDQVPWGTGFSVSKAQIGLSIGEAQSGQGTNIGATQTTSGSAHPCYSISGGAMGSNVYGGLCGDYTTGRLTLETGRGQTGNGTATPVIFNFPQLAATANATVIVDNRTGLTASTSAAQIAFPPGDNTADQNFTVCYYLATTTAGSAGTVTFNIRTVDNGSGGAQRTIASPTTLSLSSSGSSATVLQGCVPIFNLATKQADYFTSVSGATGSPAYEMHVTVTRQMM